jgi:hypothetical protein
MLVRPRSRAARPAPDELLAVLGIGASFTFGRDPATEGKAWMAAPPPAEPDWIDDYPGREDIDRKPAEVPSDREAGEDHARRAPVNRAVAVEAFARRPDPDRARRRYRSGRLSISRGIPRISPRRRRLGWGRRILILRERIGREAQGKYQRRDCQRRCRKGPRCLFNPKQTIPLAEVAYSPKPSLDLTPIWDDSCAPSIDIVTQTTFRLKCFLDAAPIIFYR